jgi:S-methylmethionine-dependent homocysteine/selenocysteine methylase
VALPQLAAPLFITDGGLETSLIFDHGIDLPDFAAFPLLDREEGREALRRYYEPYLELARDTGTGMVLDTPTWRANPDWAARLGYGVDTLAAVNGRAVAFVSELASDFDDVHSVIDGVIGPRGDGYVVDTRMEPDEAAHYHSIQAAAFAEAGADMVTGITITYVEEAVGIVQAAAQAGLPAVISFTVETDGRLPSGQRLADAIAAVDAATGSEPAYYMVNCAHPSHFIGVLRDGGGWLDRVKAVRANASRLSHAELDEADALDRGDATELAASYVELRAALPDLRVVGGCCGTDHQHVTEITAALTSRRE